MPTTLRHLEDARRLRRVRPGPLSDARYEHAANRAEQEAIERERLEAARIAAERAAA